MFSDFRTPYGNRYASGVYQAIPIIVTRQNTKASASLESIREWEEKQLPKLDDIVLSNNQKITPLLNLYGLGVELKDKYFLCDLNHEIVYFRDMTLVAGDKIFICCQRHPCANRIEIVQLQNIAMLQPSEWKQKSSEFRYVLHLISQSIGEYNLLELFGEPYTSRSRCAVGQLFSEIRRRGFEPSMSVLSSQTIGTYIGPDGGHLDFWQGQIKSGMAIKAVGVVITLV